MKEIPMPRCPCRRVFIQPVTVLMAMISAACPAQQILWDYGPQAGPAGGCWQDLVETQNFAELVVLSQSAEVGGYEHFSCLDSLEGKTFEIKFLADNGGTPGADVARFEVVPSSHTLEGGQHRYDFEFDAVALDAGSYWIGLAGVGFDAGQVSIKPGPGDSQMAQFNGRAWVQLIGVGDQMFRLIGGGQDACYPDFTGDGTLDLFDFLEYVNAFNSGVDDADCDANGALDLFDFLCFVNAFDAGC
jgi:hypothetical protein